MNIIIQFHALDTGTELRAWRLVRGNHENRYAVALALGVLIAKLLEAVKGSAEVARHKRPNTRFDLDVDAGVRKSDFDVLVSLNHHMRYV